MIHHMVTGDTTLQYLNKNTSPKRDATDVAFRIMQIANQVMEKWDNSMLVIYKVRARLIFPLTKMAAPYQITETMAWMSNYILNCK